MLALVAIPVADHKQLRWKFHENRKSADLEKLPADIVAARQSSTDGRECTLEAQLPWIALGIKPRGVWSSDCR